MMLSLDQIHTEPPPTPKELDWAEQGFLPPLSPLRCAWRRDVPLDCKISPEDAQARAWTAYYYDLLQCTLQQEGLPETIDHTKEPRTGFGPSDITICVLGSPTSYLSVLLEGGNQCPGAIKLQIGGKLSARGYLKKLLESSSLDWLLAGILTTILFLKQKLCSLNCIEPELLTVLSYHTEFHPSWCLQLNLSTSFGVDFFSFSLNFIFKNF